MAITYKKGEKDLKYTGMDNAMHKFGSALEKIKSGVSRTAKKAVTAIPRAMERKAKGDAVRELDNITRAFGSVENYEKLYPDTAKRHEMLRKKAGMR